MPGGVMRRAGLRATPLADARVLAVARHTLSRVLHGHAAISPEVAIRPEKAGWSRAGCRCRRQASHDPAQARTTEHEIHLARQQARSAVSD